MKDKNGAPLFATGRMHEKAWVESEAGPHTGHLLLVPQLGVGFMTVDDAAELTALDMWFEGQFPEIEEQQEFDGNANDPKLIRALQGHITTFVKRLSGAIESGLSAPIEY